MSYKMNSKYVKQYTIKETDENGRISILLAKDEVCANAIASFMEEGKDYSEKEMKKIIKAIHGLFSF